MSPIPCPLPHGVGWLGSHLKLTTSSPLQYWHGVKFPVLYWSLCLPCPPHHETLSDKHPTGTCPRHLSCGAKGEKGEATELHVAQGHVRHGETKATCFMGNTKCTMSFSQAPHPSLAWRGTRACLLLPHPCFCGY